MQEKVEKTMKENYEAINQILNENNKRIIEFEHAIQKIEDIHRIVIPILKAFQSPALMSKVVYIGESPVHMAIRAYEFSSQRTITFENERLISEENIPKIQEWLDLYSPTKLLVEKIEINKYPYGTAEITVSLV